MIRSEPHLAGPAVEHVSENPALCPTIADPKAQALAIAQQPRLICTLCLQCRQLFYSSRHLRHRPTTAPTNLSWIIADDRGGWQYNSSYIAGQTGEFRKDHGG